MGNKFQMHYHSVEKSQSLPYKLHHLRRRHQFSRQWAQPVQSAGESSEFPSIPFPSSVLPSKTVFKAGPFALSQAPTGIYVSLSNFVLICLRMDEASVLLSGPELLLTQN